METVVLIAPITALEFFLEDYLLKGEGPILTVFSLQSRTRASASIDVLQHYRIHGVRPKYKHKQPQQNHEAEKEEGGSSATEPDLYDLAVFGGKGVRLVRLITQLHGGEPVRLEAHGPLIELRDWILDLCWLTQDGRALLGVALAHNSVLLLDPHEGIPLARCGCLDGCLLYSALLLVDQSWNNSVLVGGTVFNQLVLWRPNRRAEEVEVVGEEGGDPERKAPVERRLLGHGGVIFSISYLRAKGWLASASDDRSVRVWGVGALGGPGPTCGEPDPACLMVLYGHQARVFSVHLSPGKVYSAGEDGCCLVWDWSRGGGGKVAQTLKGHRAGGIRALAVSQGREEGGTRARWVATGGADGGVRLWRVEETKVGEEDDDEEEEEEEKEEVGMAAMTDLKFSGRGTPKGVCVVEDGTANWARSKILACTDQGAVYQGSCAAAGQWELLWQGDRAYQSYCVMEVLTVTVKGATPRKAHLCVVGNLSGGIHVFDTSRPQRGLSLRGGDGKIHSLVWVEGHAPHAGYLLASGSHGLVHRWRVEARPDGDSGSVLIAEPRPPFALPPCAKRWLTSAVRLRKSPPGALWVCGDRRGSLLLFQEGSRPRGGVGVDEEREDPDSLITSSAGRQTNADAENEKETNCCDEEGKEWSDGGGKKPAGQGDPPLQPLSCLFGVHGKQGVTSVCEHRGLLYSAGRDGCVRVLRVRPATPQWVLPVDRRPSAGEIMEPDGGPQLEVLRVQRACKGMEWLERVLILAPPEPSTAEPLWDEEEEEEEKEEEEEGGGGGGGVEKEGWCHEQAGETKAEQELTGRGKKGWHDGRECRFVVAGFQAVNFVVWDPVRQERLLTVPCGGGHRSWILWPPCKSLWPGYGALVFIKHGAVVATQPPRETSTSAGVAGKTGACGLREGVHGKGIGCVCRLGRVGGTGDGSQTTRGMGSDEGHWEVLVTGGEDTSLTVLAVQPSSGTVQVLSVITDHISNIRTLVAVLDPAGARPGKHSLSALLVSAGGRAQMQCYRLLIGWDEKRREPYCQVIQVASHRLDELWEKRRNRHKTVKADPETRYMSIAVVNSDAATAVVALACSDGAIRLFSISEVKGQFDLLWESFYHHRCVLSVAPCCLVDATGNRYRLLLSAATDGRIALWDFTPTSLLAGNLNSKSDTSSRPGPCLTFPAHQSGVNSLAVWQERTEDGCLVTVASGGDDGQLTLSVVQVRYPEVQTDGGRVLSQEHHHHHHQLLLSPANLTLLSQSRVSLAHSAPVTALSLLCPGFLVSTSPDQRVRLWRVCSTGLRPMEALYSHVADAAGLAAWGGERGPGEGDEGWVKADPGCESRGLGLGGWVVVCGQGLQLLHVRTSSP
ncbi:WD repeat-containing protein 6 [Gadus macrocephalus]|uniref:WD repeat-containing protein 6 n=1 Tax=Gadus macrocephalus TaxID=80720 RepID=UPI0028CB4B0E|nr:WD repeat-containing protein 6 [Gadus macrocephalus]